MASLVYLRRLDATLTETHPVSVADWAACLSTLDDLRLVAQQDGQEVQFYHEDHQQWEPLFELTACGEASLKAAHLAEDHYVKAMQVAQCLHAALQGEEGEYYYLPEWHDFFWQASEEVTEVSLDEVLGYRERYGVDTTDLANRLAGLPRPSDERLPPRAGAVRPPRRRATSWKKYRWLLWLGSCVLLYLLIRSFN